MELKWPPPQWLVASSLGRLSLQVQQAAVWLTDYYWFPDGFSVHCQYMWRSRGGKKKAHLLFHLSSPLLPHAPCTNFFHLHLWLSSLTVLCLVLCFSLIILTVSSSSFLFLFSLKPSPHSPQSRPWSPSLSSSVKHLKEWNTWVVRNCRKVLLDCTPPQPFRSIKRNESAVCSTSLKTKPSFSSSRMPAQWITGFCVVLFSKHV